MINCFNQFYEQNAKCFFVEHDSKMNIFGIKLQVGQSKTLQNIMLDYWKL